MKDSLNGWSGVPARNKEAFHVADQDGELDNAELENADKGSNSNVQL
jgi:hypothetical protein